MARIPGACLAVLPWFLALAATAAEPTRTPQAAVPQGRWGGDHVAMTVTSAGAKVEFDCAHGSIDEPLTLDADGRFDLKGSYAQEHPGPIRLGEDSAGKAARYLGKVSGQKVVLRIIVTESGREIGPFTATLGGRASVHKCL